MALRDITKVLFSAMGLCLCWAHTTSRPASSPEKPHIVLILADDLGWNDISWNNPVALSPNLEALAREGVILDQSYVQPICTPTRSALMSGRYPYTIGTQHGIIRPKEPTGLSMKRKLLSEAMKEAGYSTHIVGKWHLGFCSWDYTPTSRGFDTFWGYYTGAEDYYHHTRRGDQMNEEGEEVACPAGMNHNYAATAGYDFRNNTEVEYSVKGEYSTYSFASYTVDLLESRNPEEPMFLYLPFQSVHEPLEVPDNYTIPFEHIEDNARRKKLGMVLAMDEAVGRIVEALKSSGHYNNTIIIFSTDNGAPTSSAGNNWPLRGRKGTLWEGGTRGPAFVHSPLLSRKGVVSNE
ncbi:arylsulfatase B-like [Palaemon carinicauda]|uniref:arylsulfatase B-like n=1 Tax=Palaemon carinicauda TaxID=392227 RepID=UPI0035B617A7